MIRKFLVHKNFLATLAVFVFVLCVGGYLSFNLSSKTDPADILPHDILALASVNNLSRSVSSLQQSPFGQEIFDPSFESFVHQLDISTEEREQIISAISSFEAMVEHPIFSILSKRKCSVALLPPMQPFKSIKAYFLHNGLLLVNFKVPFDSPSILKKIFSGEARVVETEYLGEKIFEISIPGQDQFYCTVEHGVIVASFFSGGVQRFIRFSKEFLIRPGLVLGNDPNYIQKKFNHTNEKFTFYLNTAAIIDHEIINLPLLTSAFPHCHEDERFFLTLAGKKGQPELSASFANFLLRPYNFITEFRLKDPVENFQLEQIPAASTYFWTNWLDVDTIWRQLSKAPTLTTATVMFFIAQKVFEHTGVDINVLSAMFDGEVGFFIEDPSSPVVKKIPMVCFLFSLRQPEELEKFFMEILADIETEQVDIQGYAGVSLLMAQGLIQPAYYFREDLLFIADHINLIKRYFLEKTKLKMVNTLEFEKVGDGFNQPSNVLLYSRLDQLNSLLEKMSVWGLHVLEKQDEITPLQRSMLIDRLIYPLFESLQHVKSQAIRVYQHQDDLEVRIKIYMPN